MDLVLKIAAGVALGLVVFHYGAPIFTVLGVIGAAVLLLFVLLFVWWGAVGAVAFVKRWHTASIERRAIIEIAKQRQSLGYDQSARVPGSSLDEQARVKIAEDRRALGYDK